MLKVEEDGEEHFYKVVDKICVLSQHSDDRKAFANLLLSKNKIPVTLQIDSGSTCSIHPVNVYKDISGDHELKDLKTSIRPVLSLYDEETKIQTLGTRKVFVFNPATKEEAILQFIIVDKDLTPLLGLSDSESLKLLELLRENIALVAPAKPSVSPTATDVLTTLTMDTILANYSDVFVSVKNNFIAEVKDLQDQGILEKVTEPSAWVSAPTIVNKPSAKNDIRLV